MERIPPERRPSILLREAYTPMMESFQKKIKQERFFEKRDFNEDISGIQEVQPDYSKLKLFRDFPNIFAVAPEILIDENIPHIYLSAPVGHYGKDLSRKMLVATRKLISAAADETSSVNMLNEAEEVNEKYGDVLDAYTFRGSHVSQEYGIFGPGAFGIFANAVESTQHAASLLTADAAPGYENNSEQLLHDLADQHIFSRLSRIIPPAMTSVFARSGGVFRDPIKVREDGTLAIRDDIPQHFDDHRNTVYREASTDAPYPLDRPGCPVAGRGVDTGAKLLADAVSALRR